MKCRVCKECNGVVCRGEIPGLGGKGKGTTFIRNVEMLKHVKLNMNLVSDDRPIDCSTDFLGMKVDLPVYVAPIAGILNNYGVDIKDLDYCRMVLNACKKMNTMGFVGDGIDYEEYFVKPAQLIDELDGFGILTMKPWVKEGIDLRLNAIKGLKYFAMASDIDAAGLPLLKKGKIKTEHKNQEKLKEFKESLDVPFIVKGIMTKEAAIACMNANVDAIVVSNHGGRVMDDGLSTIEVLKEIKDVVQDKMTILVDGGFRSGYDVFKALALGADGVLIGRPFAMNACLKGENGIIEYYQKIKSELLDAMDMCGVSSIEEINEKNIRLV